MTHRIIEHRERLLEIVQQKLEVLSSLVTHFEDIRDNELFIEEIEEVLRELSTAESALLDPADNTLPCPRCGFECAQIHSYCIACGQCLQPDLSIPNM
jgi:hypothetical protein